MANEKSVGMVFLVLVLLVGGVVAAHYLIPHANYLEPELPSGQISKSVHIDVYMDATKSMKNFLVLGSGNSAPRNYFREFLDNCEVTLRNAPAVNGWSSKSVQFWKFGPADGPRLFNDKESMHQAAIAPNEFFTENETPIESAVDHAAPGAGNASEVKILITDLLQSDEKMERIADDMAARFLTSHNGAIAVYGVRNPYAGTVTDIPGLGKGGLPEAASSMPFYILVGGDNAADVRHVQEVLESMSTGPSLLDAANKGHLLATYFSKDPGSYTKQSPVLDVRVAPDGNGVANKKTGTASLEPSRTDSVSIAHLRGGRIRLTWPSPTPKSEFGLPEESATQELQTRPIAWTASVPVKPKAKGAANGKPDQPPASTPTAAPASSSEPTPAQTASTAKAVEPTVVTQMDEKAVKAVSFCHSKDPGLCVVLDRDHGLSSKVTYLFEFDQIADPNKGIKRNFGENDDLMRRWNLDSEETAKLLLDRKFQSSSTLHGGDRPGKTPSLSQLLEGLQGAVFQIKNEKTDPVRVATYYLYVKAR